MSKTALIVRHVPYEGIAGFRDPVEQAGYEISRIDVCDPAFSDADLVSPDLVILMGGPMGVYERAKNPWIAHEIERLAERLEADRPTLGVCLGAQMVAAALGADVYPGPAKEIGFHPIALTDHGAGTPLAHLEDMPVLHWHGDTFDLPAHTEWLARSARYPHQAFRRGSSLLALQFHAEMGIDPRIDAWIESSHESLDALGLCPRALRREYDERGPAVVSAGQAMIGAWLEGLH
ncbi:glutamine amidotransferase [Sphingobium boeckii]|uniref:GMP synthase (Glutamine-hydrolyzing) n=1 Tax=Sphingobium boeckii TaxID=1082345 RepID=A0A7W9AIQ4_9SPHN|nr:GMP synthase (glutamine-hydrolyzing) [Sphingobium boeckii]